MFYELMRVVRLVGPRYVVLENVAAITSNGLDVVLGALATAGFDAEWACIPAADVGACHRRDRWWCVAYRAGRDAGAADTSGVRGERWGAAGDVAGAQGASEVDGQQRQRHGNAADDCGAVAVYASGADGQWRAEGIGRRQPSAADAGECWFPESSGGTDAIADSPHLLSDGSPTGHDWKSRRRAVSESRDGDGAPAPHPNRYRLEGPHQLESGRKEWPAALAQLDPNWRSYLSEPVLCRGNDGLSSRVDRLKALGNAVVPQVAAIPLARVLQLASDPPRLGRLSGPAECWHVNELRTIAAELEGKR
ncbi:MAG: DNA cytosine methyltransferase [Synechococcaceae bacterium WB9_2_112]|nr:DNA cytosine methyltransferase [Synechococcaceae bacterium WB9_2_112]